MEATFRDFWKSVEANVLCRGFGPGTGHSTMRTGPPLWAAFSRTWGRGRGFSTIQTDPGTPPTYPNQILVTILYIQFRCTFSYHSLSLSTSTNINIIISINTNIIIYYSIYSYFIKWSVYITIVILTSWWVVNKLLFCRRLAMHRTIFHIH
jgi:hypothetical protein